MCIPAAVTAAATSQSGVLFAFSFISGWEMRALNTLCCIFMVMPSAKLLSSRAAVGLLHNSHSRHRTFCNINFSNAFVCLFSFFHSQSRHFTKVVRPRTVHTRKRRRRRSLYKQRNCSRAHRAHTHFHWTVICFNDSTSRPRYKTKGAIIWCVRVCAVCVAVWEPINLIVSNAHKIDFEASPSPPPFNEITYNLSNLNRRSAHIPLNSPFAAERNK